MRTISLKCTGCGASLDITPDLQVFSCGYCGARQLVRRSGGTVSLKSVEEAVSRVQHGTDRTAAELAVRRLREELTATDAALKQARNDYFRNAPRESSGCFMLIAIIVGGTVLAAICAKSAPDLGGVVVVATVLGVLATIWIDQSTSKARAAARIAELQKPIHLKRQEIQRKLDETLSFLQ